MMKKLIISALIFALAGCYTAEKAERKMIKAYRKQPKTVAEFTRAKFPCIIGKDTILRVDTTYEFVEILCPDNPIDGDTILIDVPGPVQYLPGPIKYMPGKLQYVKTPTITKTVTKYVKDSAEIYILTQTAKECQAEQIKAQNKATNRMYWIWWLFMALTVSLLFNFVKFTRK
jgi:hypothetical protein